MTGSFGIGDSRAVLIGAGSYEHLDPITAAAANVTDLAAVLTGPGGAFTAEHCTTVIDPYRTTDIGNAVGRAARAATRLLLVYYTGHGLLDRRGRLHLTVPSSDPHDIRWTTVSFETLREEILDSPARARVLILDCCFAGRAFEAMSDVSGLLAGQTDIRGTYTITSSSANEPSVAPKGHRHTAFTAALLSAAVPGITLDEVYRRTDQHLQSSGHPRPQRRHIDIAGELRLFGKPTDKQSSRRLQNNDDADTMHVQEAPALQQGNTVDTGTWHRNTVDSSDRLAMKASGTAETTPSVSKTVIEIKPTIAPKGLAMKSGFKRRPRPTLPTQPLLAAKRPSRLALKAGVKAPGHRNLAEAARYAIAPADRRTPTHPQPQPAASLTSRLAETAVNIAPSRPTASAPRRFAEFEIKTPLAVLDHTARVEAVAFSPDGSLLATGCDDGTVRIWNALTHKLTGPVIRPGYTKKFGWHPTLTFSTHGLHVVGPDNDNAEHTWCLRINQPSAHNLDIGPTTLSPDGKLMARSTKEGSVRLWDASTHRPIGQLTKHTAPVARAVFSPDSTLLATVEGDEYHGAPTSIRIWETRTGRTTWKIDLDGDNLECGLATLTFSPDNGLLVISNRCGDMQWWDTRAPKLIGESVNYIIPAATVFSPDGALIVHVRDGVHAVETSTHDYIGNFEGHNADVNSVAFSPDGALLATGSDDNTARLWKVPEPR